MAEIKHITRNWEEKIRTHTDVMDAASKACLETESDAAWDTYDSVCRDFLDHLHTQFNSPQGFANFLRADIAAKFSAEEIHNDALTDIDWSIPQDDDRAAAEKISSLYNDDYVRLIDAAAHKRAFHHCPLAFTP